MLLIDEGVRPCLEFSKEILQSGEYVKLRNFVFRNEVTIFVAN